MRSTRPAPRTFRSRSEAAVETFAVARSAPVLLKAYRGGLNPALRERVMVAVSRVNACSGCTRAHERWALRTGVTAAELSALGIQDLAALDAASRAAVLLASDRAEARFRRPPADDVAAEANRVLGRRAIAQVDAVARAMTLANVSLSTLTTWWQRRLRQPHRPR